MSLNTYSCQSTTGSNRSLKDTDLRKGQSRLLDLPAELRIYIWELALSPNDRRDGEGAVDLLTATPANAALLLTCRNIYNEAQNIYSQEYPCYWQSTQFYLNSDDVDCTYDNVDLFDDKNIGQIHRLSIKSKVPYTCIYNRGFWRHKGTPSLRHLPQGTILAADHLLDPVDPDGDPEDIHLSSFESFDIIRRLDGAGGWSSTDHCHNYRFGWVDTIPADISEEDAAWVKEKLGWCELSKKEIIGMLNWYRTSLKESGLL